MNYPRTKITGIMCLKYPYKMVKLKIPGVRNYMMPHSASSVTVWTINRGHPDDSSRKPLMMTDGF